MFLPQNDPKFHPSDKNLIPRISHIRLGEVWNISENNKSNNFEGPVQNIESPVLFNE